MRLIIYTLLLTCLSFVALADVGFCVKYQIQGVLKDGGTVRGFVFIGGYEKKFKFDDITFLDYIKKFPGDTLDIFQNIYELKFPRTGEGSENCEFRFNATTKNNHKRKLKHDFKSIKVLSYTVCHNCDVPKEETGYYSSGISPIVITELSLDQIKQLQKNPISSLTFGFDDEGDVTSAFWLISYNRDVNIKELENIKVNFLKEVKPHVSKYNAVGMKAEYNKLKNELDQLNVIVFEISSAL